MNNGSNNSDWSASFSTDASKLAVGVSYGAPTSIYIDGRRLLPGALRGAQDGNPSWFILGFTKSGGRKAWTIAIRENGNIYFAGVKVDGSSLGSAPPTSEAVRVAFFGSSIEVGGNGFPLLPDLSWPAQTSALLGWSDPWNLGIGGTGFVNTNGGGFFNYAGHSNDATSIAPDIVVVGTGSADFYTSSDGTHPTQIGINDEAVQYAARIKSIVINELK